LRNWKKFSRHGPEVGFGEIAIHLLHARVWTARANRYGATNVNIVRSNPQQLDLHFVATADYVPTSVMATVYSGS